jgi:hypothetical protein
MVGPIRSVFPVGRVRLQNSAALISGLQKGELVLWPHERLLKLSRPGDLDSSNREQRCALLLHIKETPL